jgi:hypothetical protein
MYVYSLKNKIQYFFPYSSILYSLWDTSFLNASVQTSKLQCMIVTCWYLITILAIYLIFLVLRIRDGRFWTMYVAKQAKGNHHLKKRCFLWIFLIVLWMQLYSNSNDLNYSGHYLLVYTLFNVSFINKWIISNIKRLLCLTSVEHALRGNGMTTV